MATYSLNPSGSIEHSGIVMLSLKQVLSEQLSVASQNLANADTVGFKGLIQGSVESVYRNPRLGMKSPSVSYVQPNMIKRNQEQGTLKQTGNPFDIGLNGHGFLAVQVGETTQYTRDGRLRLDSNGQLVTMDGHMVIGDNGPIQLSPYVSFSIMEDGSILGFDNKDVQTVVGNLNIIQFNDEEANLDYVGMGRFKAVGDPLTADMSTVQVLQGFTEQSNVSSITESIRLMKIMQMYEEAQKITDMDDAAKNRTINLRTAV